MGVAVGAAVVGAEVGLLVGATVGISEMVGLSVIVVTITPPTPRGGRVGAIVGSTVPPFAFPGFDPSAGFVLLRGVLFPPPPPPFPETITPTTTPIAARNRTMKGMHNRRLRGLSQKVQCVFTVPSSSPPRLLLLP